MILCTHAGQTPECATCHHGQPHEYYQPDTAERFCRFVAGPGMVRVKCEEEE